MAQVSTGSNARDMLFRWKFLACAGWHAAHCFDPMKRPLTAQKAEPAGAGVIMVPWAKIRQRAGTRINTNQRASRDFCTSRIPRFFPSVA
jgi:hypothetical protein